MFCSQKVCRGDDILLRSTENTRWPGNLSAPIEVNAFRTTNFRSSSAMRGAEFHGNTRRDSTTRILSIGVVNMTSHCPERDRKPKGLSVHHLIKGIYYHLLSLFKLNHKPKIHLAHEVSIVRW